MNLQETIRTSEVTFPSTVRPDNKRVLTSGQAGKILPIAYVPLLREDRVSRGEMRVRFELMETAERLMNAVNVSVYAHFVPYLASPRFNGMDQLNRSYRGEPEVDGGSVVPFIDTVNFDRASPFWSTLGVHYAQGEAINAFPLEAYNLIVNHRREARSPHLTQRDLDDDTLATAFWKHTSMAHIVPDFDQAMIDGEVPLNIIDNAFPVKGIGVRANSLGNQDGTDFSMREWPDVSRTYDNSFATNTATGDGDIRIETDASGYPLVFAEMQNNGLVVSLANIELAKQTAAFAKMRSKYQGVDDDFLVDLLMEGIRVPEVAMSQPILLDRKTTIFGQNQRYATDSGNLDESVTNGETWVDLRMRTPRMNTGGVIMITAEVVPEQLFERQKDYYLAAGAVADFPSALADYLDPEKVAVVTNDHSDVLHSTPEGTFGYAPLNHEWKRDLVNVGGKYYRPTTDPATDEDRQKLWANEAADPALDEDWYLATTLHQKPFVDTVSDPVEIMARGLFTIIGNTQFGKGLQEATDDYDTIMAQVDTDRITQEE
jgi:hypothetical protein